MTLKFLMSKKIKTAKAQINIKTLLINDLIHIPYTRYLTEGGVVYALRVSKQYYVLSSLFAYLQYRNEDKK